MVLGNSIANGGNLCRLKGISLHDFCGGGARVMCCQVGGGRSYVCISLHQSLPAEIRHNSTTSLTDRPMDLWVFPPTPAKGCIKVGDGRKQSASARVAATSQNDALEALTKQLSEKDIFFRRVSGGNGFRFVVETSFRREEILENKNNEWGQLRFPGLHYD